jgi:hypothetical protein
MTTIPLSALTATWNAAGTTFTGIGLSVTDTASAAGSLLMDLQVGGASKFSLRKDGQVTVNPISLGNIDTILLRDTTLTAALRVGDNATTFRIYNSYTTATNFQRMALTSVSATLSLTGANVTASNLIPDGAVVVGVTARVSTLITGATGYQIGTAGDPDRWGDITGTAVGTTSDNRDWTAGTIECFTAATDVVITAKTSNFTAGALVVAIHYIIGQAD